MCTRKILLLILSAGVVEPRPQRFESVFFEEEPFPPAPVPFNFNYEVNDAETGDTKSHQETLEDGVLKGTYTVVQPDGLLRVINYISDAENGFRADVKFEEGYDNIIPKAANKAPVQVVLPIQKEVDPPALVPYNFGYEVNDAETGDTKTHQEVLEDGVLRGSYSVVQPDGVRRIVTYTSDAILLSSTADPRSAPASSSTTPKPEDNTMTDASGMDPVSRGVTTTTSSGISVIRGGAARCHPTTPYISRCRKCARCFDPCQNFNARTCRCHRRFRCRS